MTAYIQKVSQILRAPQPAKFFLFLFIGFSIIITSCNKSSEIGLDVQPSTDLLNVGYIDTTTLVTRTVQEDSLRTDELLITSGNVLLGKYIDPVFGKTTSSIYTQLRLPSSVTDGAFGVNPLCDSIVLSLAYDTACYGKKERKPQTINVYQVLEDITASAHYSTHSLNKSSSDLTNGGNGYTFIPRPTDSVKAEGTIANPTLKLKPHLRVPLEIDFGQTLLDNQSTGNLIDNTSFCNFLKGLYITTETTSVFEGDGNIMRFLMQNAQSKMTVYYNDSLKYDFALSGVPRFTYFTHDYSGNLDIQTQLNAGTQTQNNTVYLQSMAGLKSKIEMPFLMNWVKSGPIAINKAELVIKVDPTYELDTFAVPAALIVLGINDDGTSYVLPGTFDLSVGFGGAYDATTHEYRLNIARYIQQVLDKRLNNNGLYLLVSNGAINANRVVIGGGGTGSAYQMKLNIIYTKLH